MPKLTRRGVILGLGGAAIGAATSAGAVGIVVATSAGPHSIDSLEPRGAAVAATGAHQAGIARPASPQSHTLVQVYDLAAPTTGWFRVVGDMIIELTTPGSDIAAMLFPDGQGDLTVTIGVGPRLSPEISAALDGGLPEFAQDSSIEEQQRGGDVLVSACASDPGALRTAVDLIGSVLPSATPRWSQRGFRSPGEGSIVRNLIGFHDGIIVPHGSAELEQNVWISDGPFAGGCVCVIRRMRVRAHDFEAMAIEKQEATVGRYRQSGAPLSGGVRADQVDLRVKSPEGEYIVPLRSHVRAAHPSFTGSDLMLRRGYGFDNGVVNGVVDAGLLFVCFQRSQHTFVATQQRLDDVDDLMAFTKPTASASFVVLPGATLFG